MNPNEATDANVLVAIGIVRHGERFLVGERTSAQVFAGYSEFPGGKCRPDESPEECVFRECLEETGLAVNVGSLRLERLQSYAHGFIHLRFFDCIVSVEGLPTPPFRWVDRSELARLRFPDGNQQVIAALLSE